MKFFTLEGIDGSGKTTQIGLIKSKLRKRGISVETFKNPSDSTLGNFVRSHINDFGHPLKSEIFILDILVTLEKKRSKAQVGLWDRYADSIFVSNKEETLKSATPLINTVPRPAKTFILDIKPDIARKRRKTDDTLDKIWQKQKYQRYHELLKSGDKRFVRIDATKDPESIANEITDVIEENIRGGYLSLIGIGKGHRVKTRLPIVGDREGLGLVTYQLASEHLGRRIQYKLGNINVLEICCGVGGATIFLAKYVKHIYAIDISSERIKAAKINASTFGVAGKITFIKGDALDRNLLHKIANDYNIELTITDVDWRESSSKSLKEQTPDLFKTRPQTPLLFHLVEETVTPNIVMHLSKKSNRKQLFDLGSCEIENIKIDGEAKFLNVYFGKMIRRKGERTVSLN